MPDDPQRWDPQPASAFSLVFRSGFGRFFAANLVGNLGFWFQDIAAVILLFDLSGSVLLVSLVAVVGYGASIASAPLGGLIAERLGQRRVLLLVHSAVALGAAAVVAATLISGYSIPLTLLLTAVVGAGRGLYSPVAQALIPTLVPRSDLGAASGLIAVGYNSARALGPAVGAAVVTLLGGVYTFALTAVMSLAFIALMSTTRDVRVAHVRPDTRLPVMTYLRRRPRLLILLVIAGLLGMLTDPVITLGPALAADWGMNAAFAGVLVSVFGAAAVAAGPFSGVLRRWSGEMRTATGGLAVAGGAFLVVALADSPVLGCLAFGAAGFAYLCSSSDVMATLQERIDDDVRARVWSVWAVGFLGSRPVAASLEGFLADLFGPHAALLAISTVAFIGSALALGNRSGGIPSPR